MAVRKRSGLTRWMHTAGRAAAREERETHGYSNRTGMLEATTASYVMMATPFLTTITLEMPMLYAGYVVAWEKSKGLPNIEPIARELSRYFTINLPRYFTPGSRSGAAGAGMVGG